MYGLVALGLLASGCDTATGTNERAAGESSQQREAARIQEMEATRLLAEGGDLDARTRIAVYRWIQNDPDSISQLESLANEGSVLAARVLATSFQRGTLVEVDYEQAASWLEVAANFGDAKSALELHRYRTSA